MALWDREKQEPLVYLGDTCLTLDQRHVYHIQICSNLPRLILDYVKVET